jgi:fumarate reductase iron-sulfur subunit
MGAIRPALATAYGVQKMLKLALCIAYDPRDQRSDENFYELIGDDSGVFGCMSLLACHDICPKSLALATQIAFCGGKWSRWV